MPNSETTRKPTKAPAESGVGKRPDVRSSAGRRMTRDELTRHERESRAQRMLVLGLTGIVLLMALILGFGFWRTYVARGSESVATVEGRGITLEAFARRLDINRKNLEQQMEAMQQQYVANSGSPLADLFQQQIQQIQFTQALLPEQTLQQMVDEELVRQEAARRGITVSAEEVDNQIETAFGDPPTPVPQASPTTDPSATAAPTPTPSPSPTPGPSPTPRPTADVQANVNNVLLLYGMTRDELRSLLEGEVRYRKLQEAMGKEVPTAAEQVHARHILVETEDKAKELVGRLKAGEKFEEIAKAESKDESNKEKGGDLGWFPRGQMIPEFDEVAFQLPVNQISDPVKTSFGYHIIEVLQKDPNRSLDANVLQAKRDQAIVDWLDKARAGESVKMDLSEDQKQWVYEKIKWTPPDLNASLGR